MLIILKKTANPSKVKFTIPNQEQLATILFTSGSMGNPKGSMHSIATIQAMANMVFSQFNVSIEDVQYCAGTMSHVSGRLTEIIALSKGCPIYFPEAKETIVRDLIATRPTLFFGNPLFWQRIKDFVLSQSTECSNPTPEKQINLRKMLGFDQLRYAFVGASPIPADILNWYKNTFGMDILEAYGMTETFGLISINTKADTKFGSVGKKLNGSQVRISQAGEIQVKHHALTLGYYKNPWETDKLFTDDGFLCTGDRGQMDQDGYIYLSGRVKEDFNTAQSQLIQPRWLEQELAKLGIFENICLLGEGRLQPYLVVSLLPSLRSDDPKAKLGKRIHRAIEQLNRDLQPKEKIDLVNVTSIDWTPENGFYTPTLKICRRKIAAQFPEPNCPAELTVKFVNPTFG